MGQPGPAALQHYWSMPYLVLVHFGHWDEIMAEPKPASDLIYLTGVWYYARGRA